MSYKMIVVRLEENPNYEHDCDEWKKDNRGFNNFSNYHPSKFIEVGKLDVVITDQEWQKVKKAIIETFE